MIVFYVVQLRETKYTTELQCGGIDVNVCSHSNVCYFSNDSKCQS